MNFAENTVRYAQISAALSRSRFRSRFRLGLKDRQYICDRGWETMRRHAAEQEYIVGMLLFWMQREMTSPLPRSRR